jgi:signal transduction histidine kinase
MDDQTAVVLEAQEQERLRLAGELHDGPAQALANAIFQLEIAQRTLKSDPKAVDQELVTLRSILQRELEALRGYINQLRPDLSAGVDLDEALREGAASVTARTGIPVDVRIETSSGVLSADARRSALRVAQEALRNVAKHSTARNAWLITSQETTPAGDVWQLEVGDDGQGFETSAMESAVKRRHFGLRLMRDRASVLGAELDVRSAPERGTIVRLRIGIDG